MTTTPITAHVLVDVATTDEDRGHRRKPTATAVLPSTVERVTTVLVTAMVLVAVMFVVVVATLALAARAHRRRQLDDARAESRHWVERLGGELLVLDGAAARLGTGRRCGTGRSRRAIHRCRCRARVTRGPRDNAASRRTRPSKACTTSGPRAGHSASIPARGSPVRASAASCAQPFKTVSCPSRGWSTTSSPRPAGVPASCPPPR